MKWNETNYPRIGETVLRTTLPNGLTVAVVPKPLYRKRYAFFTTRYGGMDMRFRLDGVWHDTPAGIAHYLEHKMFDTEDGNALQVLSQNGAEPNAFTSNATTAYYFDCTEHFEENLRILLSFVSVPYFTQESVDKERGIIGQEIRMVEDTPDWRVYTNLLECLYHSSPARVAIAGTAESIAEITPETLYACHKAFYDPANMMLCVVGDVKPDEIAAIAEEILPNSRGEVIERDYGQEDMRVVEKCRREAMEVSMPQFLVGFKCPPAADGAALMRQDIIADIACDILLGDSSPLYQRLYDKGLINGSFGGGFDQLPGIASSFFGTSFSTYDVENVSMEARRLGRTKCNDGAEWEILYDRVLKAGREFRLDAQRIGLAEGERLDVDEIEDFGELYPGFERLRAAFAAMGEAMRANEGRDNELDTLAERHAELMEQMEAWTAIFVKCRNGAADEASEGEAAGDAEVGGEAGPEAGAASGADAEVRWLEVSQHGIRFNLTPLSFAEEFREMREREGGAWVFTSATLSSAGRFDLFKQRLGIGECVERTWESPFNYWEQGCFYLPQMPPPANNTAVHTHNVIEKVWPLINAAGGRTFVLCTSLAAVRAAADELQARLEANGNPYPLFVQGDGPKMRLIEEFRAHGNAVLVGSMSFWEGVDVKGEALSLVVIDKIPFAPPNDPVMMARSRAVEASGRRPFDEITLPEAVITLKQGAGRLIRSEGDRGMLVICDPRILNKGYGKVVRDSLPDFYCTRREEKALEFFLNPERFREGLYRG